MYQPVFHFGYNFLALKTFESHVRIAFTVYRAVKVIIWHSVFLWETVVIVGAFSEELV